MKVASFWRGLLTVPLGVALGLAGAVGSTPSAQADTTNWTDVVASALTSPRYAHAPIEERVSVVQSFVDQAGTDPEALFQILSGVDRVIGGGTERGCATMYCDQGQLMRKPQERIFNLFADLGGYNGTPTDTIWRNVPGIEDWQICAVNADTAFIKVNSYGFLGTRPGSASYDLDDYTLGYKRYAWSVSTSHHLVEPCGFQNFSVLSLGTVPAKVKVGQTITVNPTFSVTPWRIVYQWRVADAYVQTSTSPSYTPTAADVGKRVNFQVIASKAGYSIATAWLFNWRDLIQVVPADAPTDPDPTDPTDPTDPSDPTTPVVKSFSKLYPPTITGTAKVGKTLTAKVKSWKPAATAKRYQWLRDGVVITGATKSKYTLTAADLGTVISVSVTGSRSGYTEMTKTSSSTKAVVPGSLAKGKVTVSGTPRVDKTLTAKVSKWSAGAEYHFQWYKNGRVVPGATGKTLTLSSSDYKARFSVKVWTTKDGYKPSAVRTSKRTKKVAAGTPAAVTPIVSGNAVVGETLTVDPGSWKPDTAPFMFQFQWYLNGKKVKGATQTSFTLPPSAKGKTVKVKVTGKAYGYKTISKSKTVGKVSLPVPPPPPPAPPEEEVPTTP